VKAYRGLEVLLFSFLTSVLSGDEWLSRFDLLNPEKDAGWAQEPVWIFGRREKFLTLPGFELRTVEPLASRYNDYLSIELKVFLYVFPDQGFIFVNAGETVFVTCWC